MESTSSRSPFSSLALALTLAAAMLAAVVLAGAQRASAMVIWCAGDPAIIVNGNPVDVTVSVPLDQLTNIDDVTVTYHIPSNANVALGLNTGLLFREKIVIVKDQPAAHGLLTRISFPVDVTVHTHGAAFTYGVTQVALGGTRLWSNANSATTFHTTTYGLLNIGLL